MSPIGLGPDSPALIVGAPCWVSLASRAESQGSRQQLDSWRMPVSAFAERSHEASCSSFEAERQIMLIVPSQIQCAAPVHVACGCVQSDGCFMRWRFHSWNETLSVKAISNSYRPVVRSFPCIYRKHGVTPCASSSAKGRETEQLQIGNCQVQAAHLAIGSVAMATKI